MIIDFHTHIFPTEVKTDRASYIARDQHFASLYSNPKSKIINADELIDAMGRSGIDVSVILGFYWTDNKLCAESNDYILESIARYPKRLIGFCSVQPESGEAAIREVERCAGAGIQGVGELRPDTGLLRNKAVMGAFVDTMIRHKLILLTHSSEPVGHDYPGKGDVTPDSLYSLITGFPDLTVICAHWGGGLPFYALMPEVKQTLKNVYFDTAASPFLYSPGIYGLAAQMVGADKILFGTDYPLITQKRQLKEIDSQDLPPDTKRMLLGGNAQKLLNIPE